MIELQNVTKYYGDVLAVDNLSFAVNRGEVIGLLGPNGAGKSTTLRMITGFLEPTSGDIVIDGQDISQNPLDVKQKIGYLPETTPLYREMLVYDYLNYIGHIRNMRHRLGRDRYRAEFEKTVSLCGLADVMHKSIRTISKGYRQRVGLAMALLDDPPVLVLDEPTSGLDPNQIVEIREIIKEIGQTKTVIFSTHILSQAESTCDRIVIINNGRLVLDDATDKLRSARKNRFNLQLADADEAEVRSAVEKVPEITLAGIKADQKNRRIELSVEGGENLPALTTKLIAENGWVLTEMQKQSLEDLFLELTGISDEITEDRKNNE